MLKCCGQPMIACYFRNKFKGFVCVTGQPFHFLSTEKLARNGYFKKRQLRDLSQLTNSLMEDKMQLQRRGLLRPQDLPVDGKDFQVVQFRPSQGDFYKYDLVLNDGQSDKNSLLGLQAQSFNVDSLIDLLGDNTDSWAGNWVRLYPSNWKDIDVIRIKRAEQQHQKGGKK